MTKITTNQKVSLLNNYIKTPRGMEDIPILRAIKTDVLKGNTKGVKKASDVDNWLYNQCMGSYRAFLKSRSSHLDMTGRQAAINSKAMREIIAYIRSFQKANGHNSKDEDVLSGVNFIFSNWSRLNPWHQARILLPDIRDKIGEIIPMIKNGYDNRTSANSKIEQRQLELEKKEQGRAYQGS